MAADAHALLFDLARSQLEHQERQFGDLRSRTQTLLGAAALAASFLGSTAIDRGGLRAAAVGALLALSATLGSCLYLLLPRRVGFALRVAQIHRLAGQGLADLEALHAKAASMLVTLSRRNEPTLERMYWVFSFGTALLVLQVLLWGWALAVS
jgi:hypothetical protein